MALKHFGKPENDEGTWFPFGLDKPFEMRIRRIPSGVAEKIDARHRGRESFEVREGIRRPVRELDAIAEGLAEKAAWAWTDARGLEVQVGDEESAGFWRKATGDDSIAVGQVVELAGERLTAETKKLVLRELRPFAREKNPDDPSKTQDVEIGVFVIRRAFELQRDFVKASEADSGN